MPHALASQAPVSQAPVSQALARRAGTGTDAGAGAPPIRVPGVGPASRLGAHRAHDTVPALPVDPALAPVLPGGLRRGTTVSVAGSISLVLALLGAASAGGAWCALVGFGHVNAEASAEHGIVLPRLALVPDPDPGWATAVGTLLDALDVVAVRVPRAPARPHPNEIRRLAARARARNAVLVGYGEWPGADVRLTVRPGAWTGIGAGTGRLRARRVTVTSAGRGVHRPVECPHTAELWLPGHGGGVAPVEPSRVPDGRPAPAGGPDPIASLTGRAG